MADQQQLIEDLKAGKEAMQKRGRCSKGGRGPEGSVCIVVGLNMGLRNMAFREGEEQATIRDRLHATWEALGAHIPEVYGRGQDRIIPFNEDPKTTDQDVWDVFDKTIADLGGML